jgi:DNA-binding MarR family transcriptional regulator
MTVTDLYTLSQETLQALDLHYRPAMQQALADAGLEGRLWGMLLYAQGVEPQPLRVLWLHGFSPYTTAEVLGERVQEAASLGFLASAEDGYWLTESGRRALHGSFAAVHQTLAGLELLPADDMRRLAELLRRLVDTSFAAPAPADLSHLRASRRTDPGAGLSFAAQIDQYLTDLNGFRDDSHLAAWRPYEIDGTAWEALTLIWRGEADTPEALAEKLAGRRQEPAAYAAALRSLAERGWVAEQAGLYSLTEQGRALRQQAEDETDRLFYEPWGSLDDGEAQELRLLLARLGDRARALQAGNAEGS